MTQLEKAARALWDRRESEFPAFTRMTWEKGTREARERAVADARAVLEAVREPGRDVITAMFDRLDSGALGDDYDTTDVWKTGINAILEGR